MTCSNLESPNLFIVPLTTKLQIHFAITFAKLMTVQVKLRGSRLIVTIYTFLVTALINYRGLLSITESRFEIAFP